MNGLLTTVPSSADQIDNLLDQMSAGLSNTVTALEGTKTALSNVQEHLGTIQTDLNALSGSDIYETLLSLEGIDKQSVSAFMSSPVKIETKSFYKIANYGSAMTPFYTVLCLWVGGLVLVAILKYDVKDDEVTSDAKPYQRYFGRYFTFLLFALAQAVIVALGDLFILKIQCLHPWLFILAAMYTSFVFSLFIYTLTISFGDVGKAVAVVFLVIQVAGAGGTFPIRGHTYVFPVYFNPLMPFTHMS